MGRPQAHRQCNLNVISHFNFSIRWTYIFQEFLEIIVALCFFYLTLRLNFAGFLLIFFLNVSLLRLSDFLTEKITSFVFRYSWFAPYMITVNCLGIGCKPSIENQILPYKKELLQYSIATYSLFLMSSEKSGLLNFQKGFYFSIGRECLFLVILASVT